MTIKDFNDDEEEPRKAVYFIFENPDHPDSVEMNDPELAKEFFDAALRLEQLLGIDKHTAVGYFISAIIEAEDNDNLEPLEDLVEKMRS